MTRAASLRSRILGPLLGLSAAAACSLPEPDGTEAAYLARAEGRPQLTAASGRAPEDVVRSGLLLSPEVRTAASAVSASADEVRVQRAAIFPSLALSIGGGKGDASRGDPALDLTGRQIIADFGDTKRAVTAADLDVQLAYIAFQQSVDDAIFDVLEAYDDVLRLVDLLEIRRAQFAALTTLQGLVEEQTAIGAVSSSDALETGKRVLTAEAIVLDTELLLAEARARLTELTGQPRGGRVSTLSAGACASPDDEDGVRIAQLQLARAQVALEDAENARAPRAFVEPLARQSVGDDGLTFGVNVGIDSDLLQGGALTARVNEARNTRDGAIAEVAAARRSAVLDENTLKRRIAAAAQRSSVLTRQIALLDETRTLYRSQYFDLGTREVIDLLDNEEEFYDRQADLISVRSDSVRAQIECAIREDKLRQALGIDRSTLYGLPLDPDDI